MGIIQFRYRFRIRFVEPRVVVVHQRLGQEPQFQGSLLKIVPNPIGTNNVGSYSFLIPKYINRARQAS